MPPNLRGALPVGKGMWMYQPKAVEGGNAEAIIARATAVGLTHIFVRTGSSKTGFYAADFLSKILPVAHAHGIRIYGWDFPYLDDIAYDIGRGRRRPSGSPRRAATASTASRLTSSSRAWA